MSVHVPILVHTIADYLLEPFQNLNTPHWLVDCTLGGGGHTLSFLQDERFRKHKILAMDRDPNVIAKAQTKFSPFMSSGQLELMHAPFSELSRRVGERPVLGVLADLGFSSDQIEEAKRGFSFQKDGPLDMRLDPTQGETCLDFLQYVNEGELLKIFSEYGEERFSKRIAARIISVRRENKLPKTTMALADLISNTVPPPYRHGRLHPATRCFQSLRIYINQEMDELDRLLRSGILCLKAGGRVAILSFHSLEDRKVKQAFKDPGLGFRVLTKKIIRAGDDEVAQNPRARSAKLRVAERVL